MKQQYKPVILIVDDKQANLLALEQLLLNNERSILRASTGKEALKTALTKTIDLIILDVQMPEMDGFEVAQILQSNKKTREIPIIFASAERTEHHFMMQGFEEGAIDYFFKPLNPEVVKAKVNVHLKIQMQKRELIEKNASLQKSDLLINNSADIIGIIDVATFKIEEINTAFTSILGYSQAETRDTTITFFLGAEDRNLFAERARQDKEYHNFDTRIYCKDRSVKWLQWKVVVRDGKWFINARDITGIKEVEQIRTYLATVVKQSNDAIYIHNNEGRIISWNHGAELIYGYTEEEALQMRVWNIIPQHMHGEIEEIIARIIKGEKIDMLETRRITRNGRMVDVLFSAAVITDNDNENTSIAITERDITQQKIADEQIKQLNTELQNNVHELQYSNKELESFSYSISHDLRAPLRALNAYSNIMEEDHGDILNEDARKLLDRIKFNSERMGLLIDALLAFSKLGRKEVVKVPVDMNAMVQQVLQELADGCPHSAAIIVHPLPAANADRSLINQVWSNLISNAIKYSCKKESPQIEIGAIQGEGETTYYVKDNGAGFNMKYSDKLFGVFQRLHSNEEFEGTGIGLAIVQKIVNKHGGRIWADAVPDEGATFSFTLPDMKHDQS